MTRLPNVFANLPASLREEFVETLLAAPHLRVERIISLGHTAPPGGGWYDQDAPEWVLLLAGAARLRFEDDAEPLELAPGAYVNIPARRRHRVEWTHPTQPTVWLAIHYAAAPEP